MTTILGIAIAVVAVLLLIVWAGPYVGNWLLNWYWKRITKRLRRIQEGREEMRAALSQLENYIEQRKQAQEDA